jgi:hypothetical protein
MDAKAKSKLSESQVDAIARLLLSLPPLELTASQALKDKEAKS